MTTKSNQRNNNEITSPNAILPDRLGVAQTDKNSSSDSKVYTTGELNRVGSSSSQLDETQKKGVSDGHNRNVAGRSDNPSGIKPSDETPWNENEKARPEDKMYVEHQADENQDEVSQTANKEENDQE